MPQRSGWGPVQLTRRPPLDEVAAGLGEGVRADGHADAAPHVFDEVGKAALGVNLPAKGAPGPALLGGDGAARAGPQAGRAEGAELVDAGAPGCIDGQRQVGGDGAQADQGSGSPS